MVMVMVKVTMLMHGWMNKVLASVSQGVLIDYCDFQLMMGACIALKGLGQGVSDRGWYIIRLGQGG